MPSYAERTTGFETAQRLVEKAILWRRRNLSIRIPDTRVCRHAVNYDYCRMTPRCVYSDLISTWSKHAETIGEARCTPESTLRAPM